MQVLSVLLAHIYRLPTLPLHHKDPFDRLLIAQAIAENLTIVSADGDFSRYPVSLLW
jgi:PIN domain nuclease of toxin-antitoxin system